MYSNYKKLFIAFFILFVFVLLSCKKENTAIDYNPAIDASKEFVSNQQMMTQILNTYFKSLNDSLLWADGYTTIDGAGVSIHNSPVYMMEIFYPVWGNYDGYGHFRMGVIEAVPVTDFTEADVLVNFNFVNFLYDKDTVQVGKMSVQHLAGEIQNSKKFEVAIDSAIVIYKDTSGRISFNMNQVFNLKKDDGSEYTSLLDQISITGTMAGITENISTYNVIIPDSAEIVDRFDCVYLEDGPSELQVTGFEFPAFIYFPEKDSCKNQYLIEIEGIPFPFPFDYSY